jgi:hypothetical protein
MDSISRRQMLAVTAAGGILTTSVHGGKAGVAIAPADFRV